MAATGAAAAGDAGDAGGGAVALAIEKKLIAAFEPTHLQVINESSNHNVPKHSETHFKVVVVSTSFTGKPPLDRHRCVNECLTSELAGPVHALTITAKTPEQWAKSQAVTESPPCLGGAMR